MQSLVADVLAAWRKAERIAESHPEGTRDRAAATYASERLHDLYLDLTQPDPWAPPPSPGHAQRPSDRTSA
ncbi:MAG TPA: hypothetical protein VIR16_06410 [Candidatus Limnocylindrales bacterium]